MSPRLDQAAALAWLCGSSVLPSSLTGCGSDGKPAGAGPSVNAGGFTAVKDNAYPCASPEPLGGEDSGFVVCDSGMIVRESPGECWSDLPRPDDVADYEFGFDQCQNDAGCTQFPNGFCRRPAAGEKAQCAYGCLTDDDCRSPLICLCGDPVGLCVEATCDGDEDCLPGYQCASNDACGRSFACQHEDDVCATDADCDEGQCVVVEQRRRCATDVVCQ